MEKIGALRIMQMCMIVYVILLFWLLRVLPAQSGQSAMTPVKWSILVLALYSAFVGFSLQKRILRFGTNPQSNSKSTPENRWKAGNILRLATATAVSLYGLVLHLLGGPDSYAAALMALGLILLLVWSPGSAPVPER